MGNFLVGKIKKIFSNIFYIKCRGKKLDKIFLCERVHPVIQGEGKNIGKKMVLVRVFGCPLKCVDCDSLQSQDYKNKQKYNQNDFFKIIEKSLKKFNTNHVLLTGGEPGIYIQFLLNFFNKYQDSFKWKWDIETSGIYDWSEFYKWIKYIQFNFSPKIGSLKSSSKIELKGLNSLPFENYYIIKIVTNKMELKKNLKAIKKLQKQYNIPDNNIYLMPKGIDRISIINESKNLVEACFKLPYNFTSRLHILIYDNKKLI